MRDVIGMLFLIIGAVAVTQHFALGIPFFIIAALCWLGTGTSADRYMDIMGPIMLLSIVGVCAIALLN